MSRKVVAVSGPVTGSLLATGGTAVSATVCAEEISDRSRDEVTTTVATTDAVAISSA